MKKWMGLWVVVFVSLGVHANELDETVTHIKELLTKNVCQIIVIDHLSAAAEGYTNSRSGITARVSRVIPIHASLVQADGSIEISNIVAVQAKQRADWLRTVKYNVKENVLRIRFHSLSNERNEASGTLEIVEKKQNIENEPLTDNVLDVTQFPLTPLANLKVAIENTGNVQYFNHFPMSLSFTLVCQER